MKILKVLQKDEHINEVSPLLYDFRQELAILKNRRLTYTLTDAEQELSEYFSPEYEVYISVNYKLVTGYAILKIFDETVWLEQLYVMKNQRRNGIASALLDKANSRAKEYGKETAFINVHPNNYKMIKFLASQGYNVLNLIEIRKLYNNEKLDTRIQVGESSFLY